MSKEQKHLKCRYEEEWKRKDGLAGNSRRSALADKRKERNQRKNLSKEKCAGTNRTRRQLTEARGMKGEEWRTREHGRTKTGMLVRLKKGSKKAMPI